MPIRALPLMLAFAAAALPSRARAEDDPACAKFQDPLAYNACLASHGPKAKDIGSITGAAEGAHASPTGFQSRAAAPAAPARIWRHAARVRGRAHMEFRVR